MATRVDELVAALPDAWLENYVAMYEAGRVQRHPQARFVNAAGECCLVAALAGVDSAAALADTPLWSRFLGTELEALSRLFESRRLTGAEFYTEVLLELTARRAAGAAGARGMERPGVASPGATEESAAAAETEAAAALRLDR